MGYKKTYIEKRMETLDKKAKKKGTRSIRSNVRKMLKQYENRKKNK